MQSQIHVERARRRVTQEKLAEAIGVSKHAIYMWENGYIASARLENIVAAARFLHCSIEDLFIEELSNTLSSTEPKPTSD